MLRMLTVLIVPNFMLLWQSVVGPVKSNACVLPLTIHSFWWGGCFDTTSYPQLREQTLTFSELLMKTARRVYYLQYNVFLIQLYLYFIKGRSQTPRGFQFGIISSEFDMFENCVFGMEPVFRKFHSFPSIQFVLFTPLEKKVLKGHNNHQTFRHCHRVVQYRVRQLNNGWSVQSDWESYNI